MPLNTSYVGRHYTSPEQHPITREAIRYFAFGIADPNPLYTDVKAARAAGHPDLIAPPTFPVTVAGPVSLQLLEDPGFGLEYSRTLHSAQRFFYARPIRAGDLLRTELVLEKVDSLAGRGRIVLRSRIRDARDEPVVTVVTTICEQ